MVSWAGDGLVAGYDPLTKKLKGDLYHLATPGSVDLNGVTRLRYALGAGLSAATYPNRLSATVPFTFVSGDFSANPGKKLSAAMFVVSAANFAAGHVPTASEILALGDARVSVFRATRYVTSAQTITFSIPGAATPVFSNTKYWVLVLPTALADSNSGWSILNDKPMAGITVDTFARAVSLWMNRTPAAPVITSPPNGFIAAAGSTINFAFTPGDADAETPVDAAKYNSDVAGVQIQYSRTATVDDPTPEWHDLPMDLNIPGFGPYRGAAWQIRGSRYWNGLAGLPELETLISNCALPIIAGASDAVSEYQPGKGALPAGDWQLRVRTFDYGHPYPNSGTLTTEPGPLGINPATTQIKEPAKDNYPAENTSPWSTPIRVATPAQVPPPLPLSPKDAIAVPDDRDVTLTWQFRNTHQPPRLQYRRAVQIRGVGDQTWSTVFDEYSDQTSVVLPVTLTNTDIPVVVDNDDFEDGTVEDWASVYVGANEATLTNITSAPDSHAGSHYLRVVSSAALEEAVIGKTLTPPGDEYENGSVGFWLWDDLSFDKTGTIIVYWLDADDAPLTPSNPFDSPFSQVVSLGEMASGWNQKIIPAVHRPSGGVSLRVELYLDGPPGGAPYTFRLDDISVTWAGIGLDDFSMSATNEYEWRVQVTDTDGEVSNYSTSAKFWVVPAAGSGEVRVLPSETVEGATLGCGTHRIDIFRRGGTIRVGEVRNLSYVDWGRVRDDISTAKVVVSDWDIDCGNLLSVLEPWAYEMVVFRDNSYSVDRVWEGPITLLTYETDKVTIEAGDVMRYAYRRIIKQAMNDTADGDTVTNRAQRIIQNAFAPDDPNVLAYLQVLARDDDAREYRSTPAYSRTAFEEVDDMAANAGLDYTVVGRAILLWGTKHRIGTLPEFKDKDLGSPPIVSVYGMNFANRYAVSDGNGVWGEATRLDENGEDPIYGLVEMLSSTWASDSAPDSGTYTEQGLETMRESFAGFSERSISTRYPPPVVVRVPDNTSLNPGTTISIQQLVPGVALPLRSTGTLRKVVATQKLDSVKVVEQNGSETITITLSSFSRDDATAEAEADA
jgi:hypothetical protein